MVEYASIRVKHYLQCDVKLEFYELLTTWYSSKKETIIDFLNCVEPK